MEIDLMARRYKVIADYPSSCFFVGEILHMNLECAGIGKTGSGVFARSVYKPEKYPHLFQPLPWWSDRKVEDLPKYLRYTENDAIYKVIEYGKNLDRWTYIEGRHGESQLNYYLPATEKEFTEYQAFISTTKK